MPGFLVFFALSIFAVSTGQLTSLQCGKCRPLRESLELIDRNFASTSPCKQIIEQNTLISSGAVYCRPTPVCSTNYTRIPSTITEIQCRPVNPIFAEHCKTIEKTLVVPILNLERCVTESNVRGVVRVLQSRRLSAGCDSKKQKQPFFFN